MIFVLRNAQIIYYLQGYHNTVPDVVRYTHVIIWCIVWNLMRAIMQHATVWQDMFFILLFHHDKVPMNYNMVSHISSKASVRYRVCFVNCKYQWLSARKTSSAFAIKLRLSCTNPLEWYLSTTATYMEYIMIISVHYWYSQTSLLMA